MLPRAPVFKHFCGMEGWFWALLALLFYTYLGYGLLLWLWLSWRRWRRSSAPLPPPLPDAELPAVTVVVAAYNEAAWIAKKLENGFALDYPQEKLSHFYVTDGSNDETPAIVADHPKPAGVEFALFHQPERRGKIAAIERIMPLVKTPIVVFTDANTWVNSGAIRALVHHYQDPRVGSVSGEKRIAMASAEEASSAGEGLYWRYESQLKRWDAELYSLVGAAGELFSLRTAIYEPVPTDTITEDFYTTLRIAQRGYRVAYAPEAYAVEQASADVGEELKRKIRIAAGGLQTIWRLRALLNPWRYGLLSWQFLSHRVLRLTLAPLALPVLFLLNTGLTLRHANTWLFPTMLFLQIAFYLLAALGWLLEKRKLHFKMLFVPYYFCVMNYAVYRGLLRLLAGRQTVVWERPLRRDA